MWFGVGDGSAHVAAIKALKMQNTITVRRIASTFLPRGQCSVENRDTVSTSPTWRNFESGSYEGGTHCPQRVQLDPATIGFGTSRSTSRFSCVPAFLRSCFPD